MSDIKQALVERLTRLKILNHSKELQQLALEHCKNDVVTFVRDYCVTYDPRRIPSYVPFIPFEFQENYLRWLQERYKKKEHSTTLKARDTGASYLACANALHKFLFEPGYKATFITRKEMMLDSNNNLDALFPKIRLMLQYLPTWMLPEGFDWMKHSTFCKLINPANGSSIVGEAGTNAGRAGRSSEVYCDESAFLEGAEKLEAAISNNSDVIHWISTPNGIGGLFYNKVHNSNIPCFKMEFWDDPRKNLWIEYDENGNEVSRGNGKNIKATLTENKNKSKSKIIYPWLERQKSVLDEIVVQQEILLKFDAALENVFIPGDIITAAIDLQLPLTGDFAYSPNKPYRNPDATVPRLRIAGLDVASSGKNLSVLCCREGSTVKFFKNWKQNDPTQLAYMVLETWENLSESERWHKLVVDADGIGAGTLSTFEAMSSVPFELVAFRGGARASDRYYEGIDKYAYEIYANARAESWGIVKERLKKTYDVSQGIISECPEEMISLPNETILISQLSAPKYKYNTSRQIVLESKEDMAKRGVPSPDYGDSLAYAWCPSADEGSWLKY